ncbi:hypothetical protein ACSVHK_18150 [Acinetobacter nosocomialis]|uniref:hypothetical protein n=1 Tax=Acinetobacter nosocomialis TaxID=106654 RepID=UPI00177ED059|nr:hypothetical protein [Acinetobacter nosocomialis]MBD8353277.1 hypothetical protein [Acinetobacter nosocomialis]
MAKVLKDFQRRLAKVEIHRKNKATTIRLVAAFPPILSYDEWEAIAMPQQQQLVEETRHD